MRLGLYKKREALPPPHARCQALAISRVRGIAQCGRWRAEGWGEGTEGLCTQHAKKVIAGGRVARVKA